MTGQTDKPYLDHWGGICTILLIYGGTYTLELVLHTKCLSCHRFPVTFSLFPLFFCWWNLTYLDQNCWNSFKYEITTQYITGSHYFVSCLLEIIFYWIWQQCKLIIKNDLNSLSVKFTKWSNTLILWSWHLKSLTY